MANAYNTPRMFRRSAIAAAVIVVFGGLVILANSVVEDLSNLASAQSDNQQWTLTQAEVEFLEFSKELASIQADPERSLTDLKRRFDVFYSRIATLDTASVYRTLQDDVAYRVHLQTLRAFLDDAVVIIDLPADSIRNELPTLARLSEVARPAVRQLTTNALSQFAANSEARREEFAQTLLKLALAIVVLLAALSLTVVYMRRLAVQASTQRRQAQQEAARSDTIIQTSLDGVVVADQEGVILAFNAAAERIFGHRAEDVVGAELGPLIVPDHMRDAHEAGMERMKNDGEKRVVGKGRVQLEAKHSSGKIFPVELAIQNAQTDQGPVFIAFLRDISARVSAEQELVEARDKALAADRLKTEFLATMSHEIRTPLNGLLGNLTLLQDTKLNALQRRYTKNMGTSGDLLLQHVTNVLDLSRYDVDNLDMRRVPVNLSKLLQSIVDSQSGMAANNNTVIEWSWVEEPHDWVISDPDALQHIFMNLVSNAVKFTHDGRVSLSVDATPEGDDRFEFTFHVSDTGQGIAPDLQERIFDDFVTGTVAYDRNVGGTGLGLGIVRRSVKALGGVLDVESEVGVGSTFEVRLPLELTINVEGGGQTRTHGPFASKLNILVVEDNEINQLVARELLTREGHKASIVNDGAEAIALTSREKFDLILMDISMPVMDGPSATRAIRTGDGPNALTPIVALTANAMKSEQEAFLQDGMNGILLKPLSLAAFHEEMHRLFNVERDLEFSTKTEISDGSMREAMSAADYASLKERFVVQVEDLHEWLGADDRPSYSDIVSKSHNIAGSASVFGILKYAEMLNRIEDAAKAEDDIQIRELLPRLRKEWGRASKTL